MSNRIDTPLTNEHFAAWCLKMVGQPYWYGTCAYKATKDLANRKAKQYPEHYTSSRSARLLQDISAKKVVCDCIGGAKGYAWTGGGIGVLEAIGTDKPISSQYGSHGCPDKSANSMFSYAKSKGMEWGAISTLPDIVGLALHKDGHVGYTVGNGYAVEWRGFDVGCVKTKIADRSWKYWYKLPFINYGGTVASTPTTGTSTGTTLGSRLLKSGMKGVDVKALQEILMQLGYSLPKYGADGEYGSETEKAVRAFQKASGLEQDGAYGEKTHAALMDALGDAAAEEAQPEAPQESARPAETPSVSGSYVVIVSQGGKVNIRKGNGTEYGSITQVAPDTKLEYVAKAKNGWYAVVAGAQVGWVSGNYAKVKE